MATLIDRAKSYKWIEVVTTQGNSRQVPEQFEHESLTKSIEFLHAEGFSNSEIGKLMWIRQQHVVNCLASGTEQKKIQLT